MGHLIYVLISCPGLHIFLDVTLKIFIFSGTHHLDKTLTVSGYVHNLQTTTSYVSFNLQMAEGFVRIITFNPGLFQKKLEAALTNKECITITKFTYIKSKISNEMDIKLTSHSEISTLPNPKFSYQSHATAKVTVLSDIDKLQPNTKISVKVFVVADDEDPEIKQTQSGPVRMQNKYISDATAVCQLTVWGNDIDQIKPQKSYSPRGISRHDSGQSSCKFGVPGNACVRIRTKWRILSTFRPHLRRDCPLRRRLSSEYA